MRNAVQLLRQHGIQPTPQRTAVVESVLSSTEHPTAEQVFAHAKRLCPTVSRATVYNTLNLLIEKRLLRTQILREGTVVFDPNVARHHHFIDDETGKIFDVPWESLTVTGREALKEYEISEYQVVMRGKKKKRSSPL